MKRVCLLRRAFQRDMNVSKTEIIVFLKVLIINSSKFIKTSSELISTRSELISTRSELISTRSELISTRSELISTSSELISTVAEQKKGRKQNLCQECLRLVYSMCVCVYAKTKLQLVASAARFDLLEEVVALVVNEDECGEVLNLNFPNSFHAEFGIFNAFDALDVLLRKDGSRSAD